MIVAIDIPSPTNVVTSGLEHAATSVLAGFGRAVQRALAGAARTVVNGVVTLLSSSATIDLRHGWWAGPRGQRVVGSVAQLAAVCLIAFLLLAVIHGVLTGDPGRMLRAAVVAAPMAVFGTVVLAAVTELLVGITDGASRLVLDGVGADVGRFLTGDGPAAPGLLTGVVTVLFLLGGLLVWIELLVRASLVYLLVAFAPLTLAARVWLPAAGAFRKLVELGVALIVSKFAVALALGLGAAALAGGGPAPGGTAAGTGEALGSLVVGASLMLVAAFCPFVLLRLIPVAEAAVAAHGISRTPVRAAQGGMQAGYYAQGLKRLAGTTNPPGAVAGAEPTASTASGGATFTTTTAGTAGGRARPGPASTGTDGTSPGSGTPRSTPVGADAPPSTTGRRSTGRTRRPDTNEGGRS